MVLVLTAQLIIMPMAKAPTFFMSRLQSREAVVKAKAFKPYLDFEARIFRCCFVKMLVNPKGLTALLPCPTKNPLLTKFEDLKVTVL